MNRFERRIVAYVDVLGLSEILAQSEKSKRYAEAIDAIISPIIRQKDEPWLVLPHVRTGEEIEVDISDPITKGSRITTISDAILLSAPLGARSDGPEQLRRIFTCLRSVYSIQRSLLVLGLRTRGGIAVGGLLHKSHLVVGDGLVRAYDLESKIAIYPRAVIDQAIIKSLLTEEMPNMALFRNRVAHLIRQDSDGEFFVDYVNIDPVISGTRIHLYVNEIVQDLYSELNTTKSLRIRQKLQWMAKYIEVTNTDLGERGENRRSHASSYFSSVYHRDDENLLTYVERVTGKKIGS